MNNDSEERAILIFQAQKATKDYMLNTFRNTVLEPFRNGGATVPKLMDAIEEWCRLLGVDK